MSAKCEGVIAKRSVACRQDTGRKIEAGDAELAAAIDSVLPRVLENAKRHSHTLQDAEGQKVYPDEDQAAQLLRH